MTKPDPDSVTVGQLRAVLDQKEANLTAILDPESDFAVFAVRGPALRLILEAVKGNTEAHFGPGAREVEAFMRGEKGDEA